MVDDDTCLRCGEECDTTMHNLWECINILPFLNKILKTLKQCENLAKDITMREYLFGLNEANNEGINHILIELKMFLFYTFDYNDTVEQATKRFFGIVRRDITKEKSLAHNSTKYDSFVEK